METNVFIAAPGWDQKSWEQYIKFMIKNIDYIQNPRMDLDELKKKFPFYIQTEELINGE